MARIARVVVPNLPHHVTQRGNRRLPTFFGEGDYAAYYEFLAEGCAKSGTALWAYCLMPNHVHLLLVPTREDGLRTTLSETHRRYTRMVNSRKGWRGHLWQERFASYPADGTYLLNVARYIEMNPVRARLTERPEDYRWSSAHAHIHGLADAVLDTRALLRLAPEWRAFLQENVDEKTATAIRLHENTGRPFGDADFIAKIENTLDRILTPQKRGKKPKIP